jgi:uncharacterized membrane protein
MPEPLHPALVHFPIVLAFLAPIVAATLLWAIQSGRLPGGTWLWVVALQAVVLGAGWLSAEAGEREEDRVEKVVAHDTIHEHEEAAERFLGIAALTLVLSGAGMLRGQVGAVARGLTVASAIAVAAAVGVTGHSGGELVYRHGAALAYTQGDSAAADWRHEDDEDDDD